MKIELLPIGVRFEFSILLIKFPLIVTSPSFSEYYRKCIISP